ncbi:MAG: hypothetical protein U0V04_19490 [Spirosomataceae bacterium]
MALIDALLRHSGLKSTDPERLANLDAATDIENKLDPDARRHLLKRGFEGYDTDKYVDAYSKQYAFQTSVRSSLKGQKDLLLELADKLEEVLTDYQHIRGVIDSKSTEINSSIVVDEVKEANRAFEQTSKGEIDKVISEVQLIIDKVKAKL